MAPAELHSVGKENYTLEMPDIQIKKKDCLHLCVSLFFFWLSFAASFYSSFCASSSLYAVSDN